MVATTLFVGSMRSGEALTATKRAFVSGSTLLNKHLTVEKVQVGGKEKKFLKLFLENLKEDTSKKGAHIKLFELGNFFCPVRAYFKGKQISRLDHYKEMPMFQHEDS